MKISGLLCSARLALALISFLGCIILYASRSNLSFSLVCMVNQTAIQQTDASLTTPKHRISGCQAEGLEHVVEKPTVCCDIFITRLNRQFLNQIPSTVEFKPLKYSIALKSAINYKLSTPKIQ
jgi:hypothetical protein